MNQRVVVSLSAVALVAVAAGAAALAARGSGSSHTPKTITIQGADVGASATTMAASAPAAFMGPNSNFTFVLAGDLPLLDGDRPAWQLPANPTVDLGTIATLAKTLGVDGEVKAVDGGWQVGDQNSGHGLFVGNAAGLPWYYSNNANLKDGYVCPAVTSVPGDGGVMLTTLPPDCTGPPPPVGVPTKDEALAKAGELLKALGIDTNSFSITANASEWSAEVLVMPNLEGITAQSLMSSFSFGGEGKLQFANGFLLSPERADSYPRIGTTKAFELLKSGEGFSGYLVGYATDSGGGVATVAPVVTTELPASETTYATTVGTNCMAYDPASGAPPPPSPVCMCSSATDAAGVPATTVPCGSLPCEPPPPTTAAVDQPMSPSAITCGSIVCGYAPATTIPGTAPADATTAAVQPCPQPTPPEPVTITITGVHETLLQLMGADGSMWLVPGYEFTSADGGTWPVLAIDKSFVDQVAPALPTPETLEAVGSSSAPPTTTAGG